MAKLRASNPFCCFDIDPIEEVESVVPIEG